MRRFPRARWRVIALLAVLVVVAAACGSDKKKASTGGTTKPAAKAVAIAFVGALTGDNANLGINIRNGAKVAVDAAKKAGLNVELKEFDTQGSPDQASTLKDQFIDDKTIIGIVGPAFSGETKAVLKPLEDAGLVMISASATAADIPSTVPGGKVFHRLVPDDDVQGASAGKYIANKLKAKTAAYIHDNTAYGKPLAEGTQKAWEAAGVRTSGDGTLDKGFIDAGGAGADGAQISCACNLATTDSPGKLGEFAKAYKAATGKDPGTYSSEGYDAAGILLAGIKAGKTSRPTLLD